MWFRNLLVYRLNADHRIAAEDLESKLSRNALQPCGSFEMEKRGWVCPRGADRFLHTVEHQWLLALGVNQKLLPAAVVNQTVKERADVLAAKQDHAVGRKQMREIRERALEELMPKAFTRRRTTHAWVDPVNRWLVVATAGEKKAEELLETLRKADPGFPARRLDTERSPASAMTHWLTAGEVPGAFTLDQDLELRSADESQATVRYVRHALEGKEIRDHIAAGKTATRLGLTWKDRISFVLTDQLQVKHIVFLDLLKEETAAKAEDADEQFDIDFALMSGELAHLLADLTQALGGEKRREP
jgi:recombination associated protein RdgC